MLAIHAAVAQLPERVAFGAIQARERNVGYFHMLLKSARPVRPRGKGRIKDHEIARFAPSAVAQLPIAPPAISLSDLASAATQALPREALARTTHIVVAHATLNQAVAEAVPGRLQDELALKAVLPLAITQLGSLGFYAALPVLEGLLGDGQALVVAADKWLYPLFRVFGDLVAYGDGAAAMIVRRDPTGAIAIVHGSALETGPAIDDPWARTPAELRAQLVPLAIAAGRRALASANVERPAIDAIVPAGFGAAEIDAVATALELRNAPRAAGHLSSADTPIALIEAQRALAAGERRTVLVWDAALCGAAAAAVVELRGSQS
jgi:3-oxoacyl-[acyl-carrier-protein] synthase III